MQTYTAYTIYWVPAGYTISATYRQLINRWFTDIGGSDLYGILTQYSQDDPPLYPFAPIQNVSTLGGSWLDTVNAYPHRGTGADPITDADIEAEVQRAIVQNGWPHGGSNLSFFVFTARGIESCGDALDCTIGTAHPAYCAYHSGFVWSGNLVAYANMPYGGTWRSGFAYSCGDAVPSPNNDADADLEISTTSHEQFETVSDPLGDAWYDSNGEEMADKCAYRYGGVAADGHNVIVNGHPYFVQQEWSNAAGGCVLGSSAVTPTPTQTPTRTRTPTNTTRATSTQTPLPTRTPTRPPAGTSTPTKTPTRALTATAIVTSTRTRTPTATPTSTARLTAPTPTPTGLRGR